MSQGMAEDFWGLKDFLGMKAGTIVMGPGTLTIAIGDALKSIAARGTAPFPRHSARSLRGAHSGFRA